MKTKNMRKKALLSSVAMLLVAVVALGGATYAWFTTSTAVTATGVKLQTSEKSNLLIHAEQAAAPALESEGWKNTIAFTGTKTLEPISSANGEDFFTITTVAPTGVAAPSDTDFIVNNVTGEGAAPVSYSFWVRNQQGGTGVNLKITSIAKAQGTTDTIIWSGLRAVVSVDGTKQYVCNPSGSSEESTVISSVSTYDTSNKLTVGDLYGHAVGTESGVTFAVPTFADYANTPIVSNMVTNQRYHVTVSFWLEGNVTSNTAVGQTLDSLTIALGV